MTLQSSFSVFACYLMPTPQYTFIETKGFGGDCYVKIVYPNHDSYDGVRTEIYASKHDAKPVMVIPDIRRHIRPYCNRTLDGQNGVVIVSLYNWHTNRGINALSFHFNDTFNTRYSAYDLAGEGMNLYSNPLHCGGEFNVWDFNHLETSREESIHDEYGRQSVVRKYKNDYISILDGREVLSLVAVDQSILVFDLLTGKFVKRKAPLNIQ